MYSWRVTKYNPKNRDEMGSYLEDQEWTDFSDAGILVSEEDYLKTESDYINAIILFMDEAGINKLYLNNLAINSEEVVSQNAADFLRGMWAGKAVNIQEIKELTKLTLRNVIWCKLSYGKEFFVHFGSDYYMYIGAGKECPRTRNKIQKKTGLYIEDFISPYLKN